VKQFVLTSPPDSGGRVTLSGGDYHYLVRVRRLKAGAVFSAVLPSGETGSVSVESTDGGVVTGRFEIRNNQAGQTAKIILFQALPKGQKTDLIVRQAAESGAAGIVLFVSKHSVAKPIDAAAKLERWRRVVKEARQQSGSAVETELAFLPNLDAVLAYWDKVRGAEDGQAAGILLHETPLGIAQGSFHDYLSSSVDSAAVAVGPEGGFAPDEVERFTGAGFKPVHIPGPVLRCDTAALSGIAAARIILGEKAVWKKTEF
jgi:16S rRNA (uracil1498-N3)-methyltransferase